MIFILVIAAFISSIIYSKINFIDQAKRLLGSYKKTFFIKKNFIEDDNTIKESLYQMKILTFLFCKLNLVLSPFYLVVIYLCLNNISLNLVFINFKNNVVMLLTFIITNVIFNRGKK